MCLDLVSARIIMVFLVLLFVVTTAINHYNNVFKETVLPKIII